MRPRARTHRKDANHKEIVAHLRQCGAVVLDLSELGGNVADLLVRFRGRLWLLEVKADNGVPTDGQVEWCRIWGAEIVHSSEEALRVVGVVTR